MLGRNTQEYSDRELVTRCREGDATAGAELVRRYHPWLLKCCSRYWGVGFDPADLWQIANLGFREALARFDVTKNNALVTYAVHFVKRALARFTRQRCEHGFAGATRADRWLRTNYSENTTVDEVLAASGGKDRRAAQEAIWRAEAMHKPDFAIQYDT